MSGSEAEERIRAKAEDALRQAFPEARIIHELVLRQGGVRIDLAAVTPSRLVCVEIKSERDVLDRLPRQIEAMKRVCDAWRVVVADKHVEKAREIGGWLGITPESEVDHQFYGLAALVRDSLKSLCNAPARLDMLWAEELRWVSGQRGSRVPCICAASDALTGAEVRRRVCAVLRAREFPRADPVIALPPIGLAA